LYRLNMFAADIRDNSPGRACCTYADVDFVITQIRAKYSDWI
jgi:hypothetical protein